MLAGAQRLNRHVGVHAARRADRNDVDLGVFEHLLKAGIRLDARIELCLSLQALLAQVADGDELAALRFRGGFDVIPADAEADDGIANCLFHVSLLLTFLYL